MLLASHRSRRLVFVGFFLLLALIATMLVLWPGAGDKAVGANGSIPVVQVTPEESHHRDRPTLAETETGDLVVVYEGHPHDREHGLFVKRSSDGGSTWSSPATFIGNDGNWPDLTIASGGTSTDHTAWLVYQRSGSHSNIYYRTADGEATSWSQEKLLSDEDFNLVRPAVVDTPSGRVIVAWEAHHPERRMIQYVYSDDYGMT